jgi:hypothetical protein
VFKVLVREKSEWNEEDLRATLMEFEWIYDTFIDN